MRKNWSVTHKRELTKNEIKFEKLLAENNFTIIGIKEYARKTDYLIIKDNIEIETIIYRDDNNAKKYFDFFIESWELKKQVNS